MEPMKHMTVRWQVENVGGRWAVSAASGLALVIAEACMGIRCDPTGELTAKAICAEHNAALEAKGARK